MYFPEKVEKKIIIQYTNIIISRLYRVAEIYNARWWT